VEDLINSLLKSLESASGRSIGMVLAVIGTLIWWGVHLIRKIGRKMRNDVSVSENPSGVQRSRKRLSLREYHR